MKNIFILLSGLVLVSVVGCSSTTLVETQYRDGKYQRNHYSKYYDDGSYLIDEDIAVIVCVDHVRKNIPVLYGIQRWLGALGPNDLNAKGLITLYFWNLGALTTTLLSIHFLTLTVIFQFRQETQKLNMVLCPGCCLLVTTEKKSI